MSAGVVVLSAVGLFALLLVFLKFYLDRVWQSAGRGIELRHRTAYRILQTKRIPELWMKRYVTGGRLDTPRGRARAKRHALRMLDRYIRYFDNAAPFENEEAKRVFMGGVKRIRQRWAETPEGEIASLIERPEPGFGMYRSS